MIEESTKELQFNARLNLAGRTPVRMHLDRAVITRRRKHEFLSRSGLELLFVDGLHCVSLARSACFGIDVSENSVRRCPFRLQALHRGCPVGLSITAVLTFSIQTKLNGDRDAAVLCLGSVVSRFRKISDVAFV